MAAGGDIDVSIVICTRNRARSLGGTLASLGRISSPYAWEALLVDNASTDETWEVLGAADDRGGRLRRLQVSRVGLGAARDAAWREARGRIVAFTDDDCYLDPGFVNAVKEAFDEHPDAGCIGGRILLHDPTDARVTIDEREQGVEIAPYSFLPAGALKGANLAFRREVLERIGGFDPELGAGTPFPCEDADAVAAALWSGYGARFDPRPLVFHHHGRKPEDVPALMSGYDRGRGAYFAKYLLRRDSRAAYAAAWCRSALRFGRRARPARFAAELNSAREYLLARRRWGALLFSAPFALAGFVLVSLVAGSAAAAARLRGGGARAAAVPGE